MIKLLIRVVPVLLILNCGIPSSSYIGGATVISSTDTSFIFEIDMDSWPDTNGFILYSRYFIDNDNKEASFPDDLSFSDTGGDSNKFVEDLGFTFVSFILDTDQFDDFSISDTETFTVNYDSTLDPPVYMSRINEELYTLRSNYKDSSNIHFIHDIGNYSDDNGISFKENFEREREQESDDFSLEKISIEFAIITNGISGDSGSIDIVESLPVYIKPIEIRTN